VSALAAFLLSHRAEFAARLGDHIVLVLVSTAVAAAIGIPLGILSARRAALAKPIVALANLAQTIPSLALFGFLIPLPFLGGIGTRTALVALTLYAVLPVLRGTITGIQGVPASINECAVAMGLTPRQVLSDIEWPLALPSILSGVRVSVVIGVGTATIASAIGAGGLGDYIFRGLAMVDSTVILAGALPAAALALVCDAVLALAGRLADPRRRSRAGLAALTVVVLLLGSTAMWTSGLASGRDVIVGSKNFTEQIVLGELIAQVLERQGLRVERRFNLGGTAIAHQALVSGGIDAYVEYSGTSLTAIFNQPPSADRDRVYAAIRDRYAAIGITALPRLGFNNTFAILVRAADAERLGLRTIGDLNTFDGARAGFGYEFLERPDGYPGLSAAYGLRIAGQPRTMDLNLIYRALASGEIDVTAGDATSGLVEALHLVQLVDDRHYFPVYEAVPLVRAAVLLEHPRVVTALRGLEGRVSDADMRRLNYAVDGEKQDPARVVRGFLDRINGSYGQL
jgi:osmoprotectant transport system permease protein